MKAIASSQFPGLIEELLSNSSIIRPNQPVSKHSVFCDKCWNMESLVTTPGIKNYQKMWDFSKVHGFPNGFAITLAEYAYARLYNPIVSHDTAVSWLTVHNELTGINQFVNFCSRQSLVGFHQVRKEHFESFLSFLRFNDLNNQKSDERIEGLIRLIYRFWDYRERLTCGLQELPFGRRFNKLFKRASNNTSENETPVIPESIFGSIASAAFDYVLEFSPVILKVWRELRANWEDKILPLQLDIKTSRKRMRRVARKVLMQNPAAWRKDSWENIGDLYTEVQQLRIACLLVVLAFSGIRISELLDIEAGCYVDDKCEDGHIRYYINTRIHKHRESGSKDTWVVILEVVQAIKVLEELTLRVRTHTGDKRLFVTDGTNSFLSIHREYLLGDIKEFTSEAIVYQLESFRKRCGEILGRPVPEWVDGDGVSQPWKFNTRQFRRTLARYIARQPFGVIAGMLQYKHIEVSIFQGYAGTEPEWNKLLADEKVLASVDILDEVALDLSNGELAGEAGQHLKERFALEFKGRAEDYPPSQIAKWLANSAKTLFVGKFNFCFFDPTKALCTLGAKESTGGPILNHCQPDVCSNACIAKTHIPKWEAQFRQAEEFVSHPKATPVQREAMSNELNKLKRILESYGRSS